MRHAIVRVSRAGQTCSLQVCVQDSRSPNEPVMRHCGLPLDCSGMRDFSQAHLHALVRVHSLMFADGGMQTYEHAC